MMIAQLLNQWTRSGGDRPVAERYRVRLPVREAAKIEALAELFPGRDREDLVTDLLSAALYELEAAMPYVPGERVVSHDEQGDPIYEDVGLTPRFQALVQEHYDRLAAESDEQA